MNLKDFIGNNKKTKNEKPIKIVEDKDKTIKIYEKKIEFKFKSIEELYKYEKYLFFAPSERKIITKKEELEEFFKESIDKRVEGLMLKSLKDPYKPGLRVGGMFKLKKNEDDLDLVILAGIYGKGKRGGYISSFIVGVKDDISGKFLPIGKVSSGIKEEKNSKISLKNINELLKPLKLKEENNIVYYEPKIILQVKYQEILKSKKYESGYALRFPTIVTLREDKSLDEINTLSDIKNIVSKKF